MSLPGTLVNGGLTPHGTTTHSNQGTPGTYTSPMTVGYDSAGAEYVVYKTWQSTVTYANNDLVVGSDSFLYISLSAGNLAHDPTTDTTNTYWAKWTDWIRKTIYWKPPCKAVATSNITLSGTQTVDTVALVAGDRCLVTGQSTAANDGIYVVASGAWTRAYDSRVTGDLVQGSVTVVTGGSAGSSGSYWMLTSVTPTIGTTAQVWAKLAVAGSTIPSGTANQTLYFSGTTLTATDYLKNSNTQVWIGNVAPSTGVEFTVNGVGGTTGNGLDTAIGEFQNNTAATNFSVRVKDTVSGVNTQWGIVGETSGFLTGSAVGDTIFRTSAGKLWFGVSTTAAMSLDVTNGMVLNGTGTAGARLDVFAAASQIGAKVTGVASQKAAYIVGATGSTSVPAVEITNDSNQGIWVRNTAATSGTGGGVIILQTELYPSDTHRIGVYGFGTNVSPNGAASAATFTCLARENHDITHRGAQIVVATVTPGGTSSVNRAVFGGPIADVVSGGSFAVKQRTITSGTTTGDSNDAIVFLDATSGNVIYNLPAISGTAGKILTLKRIDSSANTVTINPGTGGALETAATSFGIAARDSLILTNDGTTWYVVGKYDYVSGGGGAFIP